MNRQQVIDREHVSPAGGMLNAARHRWIKAILVLALIVHAVGFCFYSPGDAFVFLIPWYKHLVTYGIGVPVGNYAPPYLYLLRAMGPLQGILWDVMIVKLLAVMGALWLAFAAARLMIVLGRPWQLGLLVLALPSVILNSSMLAQADSFWIAPCVFALTAAIEGKHVRVAAWAGLAFAVKQQAAWFAPFVAYYLISERAKPSAWLAAPAAFVLAWLPAWLAGWSLYDLLMVYPHQGQYVPRKGVYIENGASLWAAVAGISEQANLAWRWLGVALAGAATIAYLVKVPRKLEPERLMIAAIVSAALIPFLLPLMHERFFMLADILAFLLAVAFPSRRNIWLAVLVQVASAWPGFVWAFKLDPAHLIAPPLMAVALWGYCSALLRGGRRVEARAAVPAEAML